jgi:DNA repair protein RecO (recombination protein O)
MSRLACCGARRRQVIGYDDRMASEKTRAIVLRVIDFSETSCVVWLFTEDFGKINALAKGARRPKSPFEGALDLLALIRIVFLRKSSESLDLLTEGRLERRFRSAQVNLQRLYAGYYVAELLTELTDNGDPHPQLFAAADATLAALDSGQPPAETVLRFEMTALRELAECVQCGRLVAAGRVAFGMTAGGVLCPECRPGRRQVVSVSGAAAEALRAVERNEDVTIEPAIRGELRAIMSNYFAHLIGHKLRMPEHLGALTH